MGPQSLTTTNKTNPSSSPQLFFLYKTPPFRMECYLKLRQILYLYEGKSKLCYQAVFIHCSDWLRPNL
jgi:hypothetical protein